MRGFKFNFITVFAFTLLIVYSYLAAMGYLYQCEIPNIPMAGLYFIMSLVIVSVCVYIMCRAKASRWVKIGTPAQIVLGLLVVATFIFFGQYFSSYVSMLTQKESVYNKIGENVKVAQNINDAYNSYANKRIEEYQPQESTPYRNMLRKRALQRQLLPPTLTAKQMERNKWLDEMRNSKLELSNIQTPGNLSVIGTLVDSCMFDYKGLSGVVFSDEQDVESFESAYQSVNLKEDIKGWIMYLSYIIALVCSLFMLIPYFTTETDYALKDGRNDGLIAKLLGLLTGNNKLNEQDELDYM